MNSQHMSIKNEIVIFGTNDFAELAHYYITKDTDYKVVGFTVNHDYLRQDSFKGLPVVAFETLEEKFSPSKYLLFVPMTGQCMNKIRKKIYLDGKMKGYEYYSYISSRATIFDNEIGENCFILENNTIQPFTKIGNNVVMWSGNHIGHHGLIDDHVFFTSHVVLSGHCHVKERSWFGVNSTIRDGLVIEEGTLVAMGSLVTKSTEMDGFYKGSPAKQQEKKSFEVL